VRYIALVALVKIAPTHPHLISTHFDTILQCTDDADVSIRMRALDLVEVMVRPCSPTLAVAVGRRASGS